MQYDFSAVKSRISLESLFRDDGHDLKQMGGKLRCLSPFQNEKTPSCYVDPKRDRFKCFSSGHSGDCFDYLILTRNCDLDEAYALLANKAGIGPAVDGRRPLPAPIRPAALPVEERPLEPLSGDDLDMWREGVEFLQKSPAACIAIAAWRKFSSSSVRDLAQQGKIGTPLLSPWLRRQDRESGDRRVAFPVEAKLDGRIEEVAYHVRLKPREGEKRASWRYVPAGVGAWPYILGRMTDLKFLIVCEGQWDAMAMFDALGVSYSEMCEEGVAIAAMRGATNWRLFMEHYMLIEGGKSAHPEVKCLVVCDADQAGETWTTPNGDEPSLVELLKLICKKVYVREPLEGLGKDLNDVWKSINSTSG